MSDPKATEIALPDQRGQVVTALDEAAAIREILDLLLWADEGLGGRQGAAIAQGSIMAHERLDALRSALIMTRGS
jgi:hypothetical protein